MACTLAQSVQNSNGHARVDTNKVVATQFSPVMQTFCVPSKEVFKGIFADDRSTMVTDPSGAHVTGLTKDDFNVLENNQIQKISIFEEIKTQPGTIRRVDPKDTGFTNAVTPEAKTQRLTMILLDTLNTRFADQVHARRELVKFIDETLQPDEPVALLTISLNGLNVINDFTTDPKVLSAAVKKVRGLPSNVMTGENDIADLCGKSRNRSPVRRAGSR